MNGQHAAGRQRSGQDRIDPDPGSQTVGQTCLPPTSIFSSAPSGTHGVASDFAHQLQDNLEANPLTTIATAAANPTATSFHFTKFQVQRCMRLVGLQGDYFLPIDARQDEEVLAPIALQEALYGPDSRLHLIVNDVDGQQFAMIVQEGDELFDLAGSFTDPACSLPSAEYGGVFWQVQGFASDKPDDAFVLTSGNDEAGVRNICAAMQALVDVRDKLRDYNHKLNAAGRAPDGNDYNAVLDMFDL
jgi:hypothetical protein